MVCTNSCIIAGAFIFSSIFITFRVNKKTLSNPLFQLLNQKQKQKYIQITEERKNIYLRFFILLMYHKHLAKSSTLAKEIL